MKISRAKWLSLFFVIGMGALVAWNLFTPSRSYSESENRYLPGSCRVFEGRTGQVARAEALRAAFPNGFHCAPRGFAKLCAGSGSGCAFAAYAKGARRGYPVLRSDAGLF